MIGQTLMVSRPGRARHKQTVHDSALSIQIVDVSPSIFERPIK